MLAAAAAQRDPRHPEIGEERRRGLSGNDAHGGLAAEADLFDGPGHDRHDPLHGDRVGDSALIVSIGDRSCVRVFIHSG